MTKTEVTALMKAINEHAVVPLAARIRALETRLEQLETREAKLADRLRTELEGK